MTISVAWTDIVDGQVDADSPLNQILMQSIKDDLYHVKYWLGKDYTADDNHDHDGINSKEPVLADLSVTEAKMASSAISQAKLKTSTGSVDTTQQSWYNLTLPGGLYGSYPQIKGNSAIYEVFATISHDGLLSDSYITNIALYSGYVGFIVYARQCYIQASPPYNLGNGDIPLFIFMDIRNGEIVGRYIADDPPWANNGPTKIKPDIIDPKTGKAFLERKISEITIDDVENGNATFEDFIIANENAEDTLVEITQEIKQADMPLIPHPFKFNQSLGNIVLLDPCGGITDRIYEIYKGGEDVSLFINGKYLDISNDDCGAIAPPGVMAIKYQFKNTVTKI